MDVDGAVIEGTLTAVGRAFAFCAGFKSMEDKGELFVVAGVGTDAGVLDPTTVGAVPGGLGAVGV